MVLFVIKQKTNLLTLRNFLLVCFAALLFSWPIFFLTIDWGRWLNIHFIFILLTFTLFLPQFSSENTKIYSLKMIRELNLKHCLIPIILFTLLFLNSFSWTMKHVDNGFIIKKNNTYLTVRKLLLSLKN